MTLIHSGGSSWVGAGNVAKMKTRNEPDHGKFKRDFAMHTLLKK